MVAPSPTATNCVPDQVTLFRTTEAPEVWAVHVTPSGEVRMEPLSPTPTNCVPDQVTLFRLGRPLAVVGKAWGVHVTPSGEVRIVPALPTVTN
jgi:hypothetical protein